MPTDEEATEEGRDDLPTFGDLVDELDGESADPTENPSFQPSVDGQDDFADVDAGDLDEQTAGFDASKWQWGSRTGERSNRADLDDSDRAVSSPTLDAMLDLVGDSANILLIGPQDSTVDAEICGALTRKFQGPVDHRLIVTTDQSPDERLQLQRAYGAGEFDQTTIIAVGGQVRGGRDGTTTNPLDGELLTLATVHNPRDLTRLGLLVNRALGEESRQPPVICFHSLTSLVPFVEVEKLFRFLHVLQGRVGQAGGRAHYHIDPTEVEPTELKTLTLLFDIAIRFDDDGHLSFDT